MTILQYGVSQNPGGIENYLLKIMRNIDRKRYHFVFINDTEGDIAFQDDFLALGAEIFTVTHRRVSNSKNARDINNIFENNKIDIVHCHLNTLSYITPIKIAQRRHVPLIVHSRSSFCATLHTRILHEWNSRRLCWNGVRKLAVSKKAGRWLFGDKNPYTVINNGIDISRFRFMETQRAQTRKRLNLDQSFVIIHTGVHTPAKNHRFVLEVFNEILKKRSDSRLLLAGIDSDNEIGQYAQELKIDGQVLFLGRRDDIPELLSGADAFILPSFYEGFPNAVLEAQTSGLPCFISDVITDEVVIRRCDRIPLQLGAERWASHILSTNKSIDRSSAWKEVESSGFSVKDEIIKLERLYDSAFR